MTTADGICECCEKESKLVGVACIPGMPMSIAWCENCLSSGAIPYWAAVSNTAMMGGLTNSNQEWKDLVTSTLSYFGRSFELFEEDVKKDMKRIDEAFGERNI